MRLVIKWLTLILLSLIPFVKANPLFSSVSPGVVSVFGGNTVRITGTNFPNLSNGSTIQCLWQGSLTLLGQFTSNTVIECPVPSIFKFIPYSSSATYNLNDLKVSFDPYTAATLVVIGAGGLSQLVMRPITDELQALFVFPLQGFASSLMRTVGVTGTGFITGLQASESLCQFRLVSPRGRLGKHTAVPATVVNSTFIECPIPLLSAIDATRTAPAASIIQISFDGGQTFSRSRTGFTFLRDMSLGTLMPSQAVNTGGSTITLSGANFTNTPNLKAKLVAPTQTFFGNETTFKSSGQIDFTVPIETPVIPADVYTLYITVDGENYISTGKTLTLVDPPSTGAIQPTRGYYYGGTQVDVRAMNFINSDTTTCVFGRSPVKMTNFIDSTHIQCRAPTCMSATGWRGNPEECHGQVQVYVTTRTLLQGTTRSSGFLYEYVALQRIHTFEPWFGSGWDAPFSVRIRGKGLSAPLYCQWLDLPPVQATQITSLAPADVTADVDSYADCVAPALPSNYRPDAATGVDFVLAHVEISCNGVDFSVDRRQWYFYKPPVVTGLSPTQVWRGYTRVGGLFITGTNFRQVNSAALSCMWYYDDLDMTRFEPAPATFVDRTTLLCLPTTAAAATTASVKVEVQMTPNVVSTSGLALTTAARPQVNSVSATSSPYLGGKILQISGSNIFVPGSDMYVVIGDSPVLASQSTDPVSGLQTATVVVPPIPHWTATPASFGITLALGGQDRLAINGHTFTYGSVPAGSWYRPALHSGTIQPCPAGSFCGGGYPQNDTLAVTSVLAAQGCPPGTYQSGPGLTTCIECPSPSYCPRHSLSAPQNCYDTESGKVCWTQSGNDAKVDICPQGYLCLLPEAMARVTLIPPPDNPFGMSIRLLSQVPMRRLTVAQQDLRACMEGRICVTGSVGISWTTVSIISAHPSVLYCSVPGVFCKDSAASPIALDFTVPSGKYISDSSILNCPVGFACSGGRIAPCLPGTFQASSGSGSCTPCTGGTTCPTPGLSVALICPGGRVCSLPGRLEPSYLCPAGSYCLGSVFTLDPDSDVNAIYKPTICGAAIYCLSGTTVAEPDLTNPSAPRLCAVGFYCSTGETNYQGRGPCPIGNYCVPGSVEPVKAPKGSYVSYTGAYAPSKCVPGTYQDELGSSACKQCPDGYECPSDGLFQPIGCSAGNYRANIDPFYSGQDNVNCHPCPEGTWSYRGKLTWSGECQVCPERYVCARQGMTLFATKDQTDCTPNSDGVALCYANSQANDCPEGFACDVGTTSYTQYSYPCEPGYFCKSLTALREMRYLLCPSGYTCKASTGYSKAFSLVCPQGYFCSEGTASYDTSATEQVLYNVQADFLDYYSGDGTQVKTDVGSTNLVTGAACWKCDPNSFNPPLAVSTTSCVPCGTFVEATNSYIPVADWKTLKCPDGTTSVRGSTQPSDCLQEGYILAVVNIYSRNTVVENKRTGTSTPLWLPDREFAWINPSSAGYAAKSSLQYGQLVSPSSSDIVDFLGYDPRTQGDASELFHFVSVEMNALDIMRVSLDFSKVPSTMIMDTDGNTGGHYRLSISSDKITEGYDDGVSLSYPLPFTISNGDGVLTRKFDLKLLALMDQVKVNVSLTLLDGSHYSDLAYLNDAVSMTLTSPNKTDYGTQKSFFAVTSTGNLQGGGYELPYNMIPSFANQPGDLSLVIDLAGESGYASDTTLKTKMVPGRTFWKVAGSSTVVTPWLPFFSNCAYFDRHITLWDLFENQQVPPEAGQCKFYEQKDVKIVAPLIFDFEAGTTQFEPEADYCELALKCQYEDNLQFSGADAVPWMAIPEASMTLFYLTQDPLTFADVAAPNFKSSLGALDALEGTDSLIPVVYTVTQRTGKFPRLIHLTIDYAQVTASTKRIIQASLALSEFDDDTTNTNYVLQISWEPMNWIAMMVAFQLPIFVYAILFTIIGLAVLGFALLSWVVLQLVTKSTRIPPFQVWDCYSFFMGHTLEGVIVGSIPPLFLAGLVKILFLPSVRVLNSIACAWAKGASSTSSVIIAGTDSLDTCSSVRTGTCLLLAGMCTLWSASAFFAPRLPEAHKDFLVSAPPRQLQEDGVFFPAKKKNTKPIVRSVVLWKRVHLFAICILMSLSLLGLLSFSYSSMFNNFTLYYTIGYTLTMMAADLMFAKAGREHLMFSVVAVVTDVVFFIATLSALDINVFISSFLMSQFFVIIQRLIAEKIVAYMYSYGAPKLNKWVRSRQLVWNVTLGITNFLRRLRHQTAVGADGPNSEAGRKRVAKDHTSLMYAAERAGVQQAQMATGEQIKKSSDLDDGCDETAGCAERGLSLVFGPFAIIILLIFPTETLFVANYGLRTSVMPYYLLFSVLIIPFQIGLDLIINHAFDASMGFKIYDYMYLCKWRWNNRLTRWLLDDSRLDTTFSQSAQAMHHLAFSPQFYFIITYAIYGGLFVICGITCWISHGVSAFFDPLFGVFVIIMLLAQRVADAIARWLVFYVMWKPADLAPEKAFVQSIALGLKQKELEHHQVEFRSFFFKRHRQWIIENLDKVYTPRGIEKYRSQLTEIYQRVLSVRIPYLYTAPVKQHSAPPVENPSDDAPEELAYKRLNESEFLDVPLSSEDEGERGGGFDGTSSPITAALIQGWFEVARKRVRLNKINRSRFQAVAPSSGLQINTNFPGDGTTTFPGWLMINLNERSRDLMTLWLRQAREHVSSRKKH